MNDNLSHMKSLGLDVRKAAIDTDVGVAPNAAAIRDAIVGIAKEGKQCVVIAHSKGGVDAAAAIAEFDLYNHIRAFIGLQVPYGGTPAVDILLNSSGIEKIATAVITKVLRGCPKALVDLSYEERRKYLKKFPLDTRRLRAITFSSECGDTMSLMSPMAVWLQNKFKLATDGAVAVLDARLSGCDYVHATGMDHGATVFGGPGKAPKPGEIMQAMITLALQKDQPSSRDLRNSDDDDGDDDEKKKKKKEKKTKKDNKAESGDEKDKVKKKKKKKKKNDSKKYEQSKKKDKKEDKKDKK